MTAVSLKPCSFRRGQRGQLICTVAQLGGETSDIVSGEVCGECQVPEQSALSNCTHLQTGVTVFQMRSYDGEHSSLQGMSFDCSVYQFDSAEALFAQCATDCPGRQTIHRDISADELLTVGDLPAQPTDRDLRQGVLVALYEYQARFPERFLKFDVTPEHLARSLGLEIRDIYRILGPMDEAGEVRTLQDTRDVFPRYVTLTHKGIEAMQHEPLFESKGVRVTDNSIKIEGNNNQVAREHGRNEQNNIQLPAPVLEQVMQHLQRLRVEIEREVTTIDVRSEALDTIDTVLEEAQRTEPRPSRVLTGLRSLHRLLESNQGTVAAAGLVLQLISTISTGS